MVPILIISESTLSKGDLVYMTIMGVPLLCRAGRPQFDTEGIAVIMTDRRVIAFRFPCQLLGRATAARVYREYVATALPTSTPVHSVRSCAADGTTPPLAAPTPTFRHASLLALC